MKEQLLTVKDVMSRLQISRPFLHKLTKDGKIKSVKIGDSVRYQESDLQSFIEESRRETVVQD